MPRDAVYKPSCGDCRADCLSVCPTRLCILIKRLNIYSSFCHLLVAPPFQFLVTKYCGKISTGSPRVRHMQVGYDSDFPRISGFISETTQDRAIITVERQQELVCALSNGTIFNYLEGLNDPKPDFTGTPFSPHRRTCY